MQNVNENMDELFRRAAENYPLDTSSKDWNKVLLPLQNQNNEEPVVQKNRRGRLLWLLLLLPLGLVCNRYLIQRNGNKEIITAEQKKAPVENPASKAATENGGKNINPNSTPTNNDNGPVQLNTGTDRVSDGIQQKTDQTEFSNSRRTGFFKNNPGKTSKTNSIVNKTVGTQRHGVKKNPDISEDNIARPDETSNLFRSSYIQGRDQYFLSVQPVSASYKRVVEDEVKPQLKNKNTNKRFYIGFVGGIDATTIKFQKVEHAGYDYGILLGYDLNKKWSIESGIFFDRKIYYSDGKYFNTSNIWLPPNAKITAVSGNCKMLELPLAVKYTISSSVKRSWFATAGTTSYLMKKEDYNSTYYYQNTGSYYNHSKEYKNRSRNFFAAVHVSGGYIKKIGKITDLRIEPYLKLPVSGMGIGKMPFLSTGLHLGITRKLF